MLLSVTFFSLLGISILLAWTGLKLYKRIGLLIFVTALILGVILQRISPIGIGIIGSLAAVMYLLQFPKLHIIYKLSLHLLLCFLFVGFSMHLIPGFHNWKVLDGVKFSASSVPYVMYLNVEKPTYIFFFLYFFSAEIHL